MSYYDLYDKILDQDPRSRGFSSTIFFIVHLFVFAVFCYTWYAFYFPEPY